MVGIPVYGGILAVFNITYSVRMGLPLENLHPGTYGSQIHRGAGLAHAAPYAVGQFAVCIFYGRQEAVLFRPGTHGAVKGEGGTGLDNGTGDLGKSRADILVAFLRRRMRYGCRPASPEGHLFFLDGLYGHTGLGRDDVQLDLAAFHFGEPVIDLFLEGRGIQAPPYDFFLEGEGIGQTGIKGRNGRIPGCPVHFAFKTFQNVIDHRSISAGVGRISPVRILKELLHFRPALLQCARVAFCPGFIQYHVHFHRHGKVRGGDGPDILTVVGQGDTPGIGALLGVAFHHGFGLYPAHAFQGDAVHIDAGDIQGIIGFHIFTQLSCSFLNSHLPHDKGTHKDNQHKSRNSYGACPDLFCIFYGKGYFFLFLNRSALGRQGALGLRISRCLSASLDRPAARRRIPHVHLGYLT